jgi:hypothetical protein
MNNLAMLKAELEQKPIIKQREDVKIVITKGTVQPKMKLSMAIDDGLEAIRILNLMKQRKISNVSDKFPEQIVVPVVDSVLPIKKPIITKLKGKKVLELEQEEPEAVGTVPRLGEEGLELDIDLDLEAEPKKARAVTKRLPTNVIPLGPEAMITIGDTSLPKRLPSPPEYNLAASSYYMNNRETFINFINGLFDEYRSDLLDESKNISCEDIGKDTGEIGLLTHQKIVRDYINLNTPYRGLLLFHGLGSGKTCSSIAIAEGIKSGGKQVIIMTPASLQRNYLEEIKKCGDLIYRKNQFWEWISIVDNPEYTNALATVLGFKTIDYISRRKGAWLTNVTKPNNYSELSTPDKKSLNDQLDEMIRQKYRFINYNGLRRNSFKELTNDFSNNIFDDSIVIIDEAHNLISRIVNKINKITKFSERDRRDTNTLAAEPLAIQIYEYLMRANSCRIVLLTGTPIINYPNEIAVLFNILRGYIKTWHLPLNIETGIKVSKEMLQNLFARDKNMDYIDYSASSKTLVITRNPFGFESKNANGYHGVTNERTIVNDRGVMSDSTFLKDVERRLNSSNININKTGITFNVNTALPDTLDEFTNNFIDKNTGNIINIEKFKKRIIGLTSYFRSAQEDLLPKYDKNFDKHLMLIPMSNYQFKIYEAARQEERKTEKKSKKAGNDKDESTSTYRIFSRLFCNFVMPTPPGRPIPKIFKIKYGLALDYDKEGLVKGSIQTTVKGSKVIGVKPLKVPGIDEQREFQTKMHNERAKKNEERQRQTLLANQQKTLEKDALRAIKEAAKADAKEAKESAKALAKEAKEADKALAKEQKALQKALLKKGGQGSKSDDEESDSDSDSDSESDSDEEIDILDKIDDNDNDEPVVLQGYKDIDANLRERDELEGDEFLESLVDADYKGAIDIVYEYLRKYKSQYLVPGQLEIYSPKFLAMLNNIDSPDYRGLHLVYSQFRTMEGIGIFSLVLEANGFARFSIKKTGMDSWELNMSEEDMGKPTFALYTGTEEAEEREIIRNIYNGSWDNIPNNIAAQLRRKSSNNNLGEIIKVLMITSAGSEGINLRNTRYVHIMEPYWHPVRTEQVIGRARRICSHKDLPEELQTVEVFIYVMEFTKEQLDSEHAIELRLSARDKSKLAPYSVQTSDQKLYEISTIKEQLSTQLLTGIKESSIDCATYTKSNTKEGLVCLTFGKPNAQDFSFNPNYAQDESDTVAAINRVKVDWEARPFSDKYGKQYMLRQDTYQVYDYDSVIQAKKTPGVAPILLGKLVKTREGNYEIVRDKS